MATPLFLQLLDACVNNCGKTFHLEVASRDFETEIRRLLTKSQPRVAERLRQTLKKWAENEFKSDPQLSLIPSLYLKLKQEGQDFSTTTETKVCSSNKNNKTTYKNKSLLNTLPVWEEVLFIF